MKNFLSLYFVLCLVFVLCTLSCLCTLYFVLSLYFVLLSKIYLYLYPFHSGNQEMHDHPGYQISGPANEEHDVVCQVIFT